MFKRISVWLDDDAPHGGAFAQSNDWAARLHVPLHGVAGPGATNTLAERTLSDCDVACSRQGVLWDAEYLLDSSGVRGLFRNGELGAFSASLPLSLRGSLVRAGLATPKASIMVCSRNSRPGARTLVLQQGRDSGVSFLSRAVPLCQVTELPPVVLTVARTERSAAERQEIAREVFYDNTLDAEFDLVAGCEVGIAVTRVARARGCSRIILQRPDDTDWWRWLRKDSAWRVLGLADKLTLIALPREDPDAIPVGCGCHRN